MHDALLTIYRSSGLAAIQSPWLASVVLFAVFGVTMFVSARALLWVHTNPPSSGGLRVVTWLVAMLWLAAAMLAAIGLESFIRFESGLHDDTSFSIYWIALFLLSNAPFWAVLWRAGVFKQPKA